MITISVCIGSACHKRGSYAILDRFKTLVKEKNLADKIAVVPAFCLGECKNGVSVKVDDKLFLGMTEESADSIFNDYVIKHLGN